MLIAVKTENKSHERDNGVFSKERALQLRTSETGSEAGLMEGVLRPGLYMRNKLLMGRDREVYLR